MIRNEAIANFTGTSFTDINSTYSVLQQSVAAGQTYGGSKALNSFGFYVRDQISLTFN